MATPTERLLGKINPDTRGLELSILANVCALCNGPATEFKDRRSKREYPITGACQKCQDRLFDMVDRAYA